MMKIWIPPEGKQRLVIFRTDQINEEFFIVALLNAYVVIEAISLESFRPQGTAAQRKTHH